MQCRKSKRFVKDLKEGVDQEIYISKYVLINQCLLMKLRTFGFLVHCELNTNFRP